MIIFGKINKKTLLYTLWYSIITSIAILFYQIGLGANTQGTMCLPEQWHYKESYQWLWDGNPCTYSLEFLTGYILFILLYAVFDIIRRKIVGFNPSVLFRIYEGLSWFIINYIYLLYLTLHDYGNLNIIMAISAFTGTFTFFLPLFGIFIIAKKF